MALLNLVEVDPICLACLFFGLSVVLFGLYGQVFKNIYLSEPLLATLFGIILGPQALNLLKLAPDDWEEGLAAEEARKTLQWFCRIVLGIQVLFAGSTLPSRYLLQPKHWKSLFVMLVPVMTIGWLVTSAVVYLCLPSTSISEALIIGAICTPTDPVLSNSVVKGIFAERHSPRHLRELLIAESAINDGFASPFLWITLWAVLDSYNAKQTIIDFILRTVIWDVLAGSSVGIGIGYVARKLLKLARAHDTIDRESMLVFTLALALFTIGLSHLIQMNELLACFFAGTALNWTDKIRAEDIYSHFSEGVELFFDTSVFLLIGTLLPFEVWKNPDFLSVGGLVGAGLATMLLRRIPATMLLYRWIPQIKGAKEAIFVGHFGPIGVGAIYYALVTAEELPDSYMNRNKIIPTVTFIVFVSVIVHGISAPLTLLASSLPIPFTLYQGPNGKFVADNDDESIPDGEDETHEPIIDQETRPLLGGKRRSRTRSPVNQRRRPVSKSSYVRDREGDIDEDEDEEGLDRWGGMAYPSMGEPNHHRHRTGVSKDRSESKSRSLSGRMHPESSGEQREDV